MGGILGGGPDPEGSRKLLPIACSLEGPAQGDQLAQWRAIQLAAIKRIRTEHGWRLTLPADPRLASQLADLAVREHACCPFLSFTISIGDEVTLEVLAAADARPMVEHLLGV